MCGHGAWQDGVAIPRHLAASRVPEACGDGVVVGYVAGDRADGSVDGCEGLEATRTGGGVGWGWEAGEDFAGTGELATIMQYGLRLLTKKQ